MRLVIEDDNGERIETMDDIHLLPKETIGQQVPEWVERVCDEKGVKLPSAPLWGETR
jgi:hypothetical protein